jgi:hypothetical protein
MSIAELGSFGEFIASFGVLATLIFLIFQVRQNTSQIKLRSELDRADVIASAGIALMGDNTHVAFTKALVNPSDLADEEVMQVWSYLDIFLAGVSATWSAYSRGHCDKGQWVNAKATAQVAFSFPVGMVIWNELKKNYPREMTDDIEAYLIEHGADRLRRQFGTMLEGVRKLEVAT